MAQEPGLYKPTDDNGIPQRSIQANNQMKVSFMDLKPAYAFRL